MALPMKFDQRFVIGGVGAKIHFSSTPVFSMPSVKKLNLAEFKSEKAR